MLRTFPTLVTTRAPWFCLCATWLGLALGAGCKQEAEPSPATSPSSPSDTAAVKRIETEPIAQTPLTRVDAGDAPNAPACLPASDAVPGWKKTEPIRVFMTGELAGAVTPAEVVQLGYFRVLAAATCVYASKAGDGADCRARVLLVETESPIDAYGILTCHSESQEMVKVGGETRADRTNGMQLHCWQGKNYVRISSDDGSAETTDQLIRLLFYITGHIQREDRPAMVDALPADAELLEGRWLVRHLGSLPPAAIDLAAPPDLMKTSELLGLGEKTVMCVGRYKVPEGRGANVVWVVQYPANKAAYDAHARYTQHLMRQKDAASMSTNLLPPHGPYLIGTWTAEEEALQYMMPRIAKLLPF